MASVGAEPGAESVRVSVAIENENEDRAFINVFLSNPQQNSPHLYMEDKLIHTNKKLSPPVAYQLFSWDYRGAVAEKFSADSPRRILDRVKLAWQDAPQLVHRGYFELERKVWRIFASRYPDEPTTEPRKDFPGENCASGEGT